MAQSMMGFANPSYPLRLDRADQTSYWTAFLDIPFVQLSEAMFFEPCHS